MRIDVLNARTKTATRLFSALSLLFMPSQTFPFRFEIDRGFEHLGRNEVPQRYGSQLRRGGLKAAVRRFNAMCFSALADILA
jgi:hypothetical protein